MKTHIWLRYIFGPISIVLSQRINLSGNFLSKITEIDQDGKDPFLWDQAFALQIEDMGEETDFADRAFSLLFSPLSVKLS